MYLEKLQREMLGKNELWPLVTNGFSNPYHLNESTFRGISRFFFIFSSFFDEFPVSIYNGPRFDAAFRIITSVAIENAPSF